MDGDAWGKFYDKAFANGHRSGFLDAVSELRDMAHEAYEASDLDRERLLHDLARELRGRYEAVEAREAGARARMSEKQS